MQTTGSQVYFPSVPAARLSPGGGLRIWALDTWSLASHDFQRLALVCRHGWLCHNTQERESPSFPVDRRMHPSLQGRQGGERGESRLELSLLLVHEHGT